MSCIELLNLPSSNTSGFNKSLNLQTLKSTFIQLGNKMLRNKFMNFNKQHIQATPLVSRRVSSPRHTGGPNLWTRSFNFVYGLKQSGAGVGLIDFLLDHQSWSRSSTRSRSRSRSRGRSRGRSRSRSSELWIMNEVRQSVAGVQFTYFLLHQMIHYHL